MKKVVIETSMIEKNVYLVFDVKIHNIKNYQEYINRGKPIVEKYGGEYIIRGGSIDIMEKDLWEPTRMVLIKFPNKEAALSWYNSDEYQPVKKIRKANSTSTLLFIDGV